MRYFMGIDGGGSNCRVVITDEQMNELVRVKRKAVNPNTVGRDEAATRIQDAMREALQTCNLDSVDAVGLGIAGASAYHAETWLRKTAQYILPNSLIVPASDNAIALVGGTGERYGLLLLSGTGSVGLGMNRQGDKLQVGGWGYILGDEGSGFWMGLQALKLLIDYRDRGCAFSPFVQQVSDYLHEHGNIHLVDWVYLQHDNPIPEIAKLSSVVLDAAETGDEEALVIIKQAVEAIHKLETILVQRLNLDDPPIVFAGGLLSSENIFSQQLMHKLGLSTLPQAKYEPVIGAALLAKLELDGSTT